MRRPPLAALALATCAIAACSPSNPSPAPASPARFPAHFQFGSAVAPYQVEGGLHDTDWFQFESRCQLCSHQSADDGPDFWRHFETDFANAAALHNNAIRLGLEWARLFPTQAAFPDHPDAAALAHYHDLIHSARSHGLTVMATLDHFSLPSWIQDMNDLANHGGWHDARTIDLFARWAGFCAGEFGADIDWWITINEPLPYVFAGWIGGVFPPGHVFDTEGATTVMFNQLLGHARAFDAIHARDQSDADGDGTPALVSIAQHSRVFRALNPGAAGDEAATKMIRDLFNRFYPEALTHGNVDRNFDGDLDDPGDSRADPELANRLDWIGLNYYGLSVVVPIGDAHFPFTGGPAMNDLERWGVDLPKSDFGWAIDAAGLRTVLDELSTYRLPIVITENGLADGSDKLRPRFIAEHLAITADAIRDGLDVRGYYHWSLIDNFEWASGFCPKFGLFRVDLGSPDRTRTMGEGARVYREIIDAGMVSPSLLERYPDYPEPGRCPRVGI